MQALDTLLTLDSNTWQVPDDWHQGRGAFGGLVIAALIRALERHVGSERRLRSLTAELPAPTRSGPATITVETLRAGSQVTTARATLTQGKEVTAHVVGVLGGPRPLDADSLELPIAARPDWRSLELLPVEPPLGPEFAQHWEFRNVGPLPFSGGTARTAAGFVRPKALLGVTLDAAYLACCVDAWWPACAVGFTAPRPIATIAFTFQVTAPLTGLTDAPLFFQSRVLATHEGYSVEQRELWHQGDLVALNQQTIAIIA